MTDQLDIFGAAPQRALPEGFTYHPEVIAPASERALLDDVRGLHRADDMPPFLVALRYSITYRNLRE